ncbi:hypothetical protein QQZ08_008217 [Neonectria magnoliae]|uniref:Uncharacterized protein n=1 Tax=Neonectria magnoliae TaxID=2732573 RepID=A0ABR1HVP7_9HYPO
MRLVAVDPVLKVLKQSQPGLASNIPSLSGVEPLVHCLMAATALPFVDPSTFKVQHGVCCKGCQIALEKVLITALGEPADFALRDRINSDKGFIRHFKWCAEAQTPWISSQEGTVPVEEPAATRSGGYFSRRNVTPLS